MPHPRFKHQWEEDSYWKHYDNHQEQLAWQKEEAEREAYEAKAAVKAAAAAAAAAAKAEGLQTAKGQSRLV
jgi:hypothetical protein